jgi:DNA helicase HerA-like ATPase
MTPRILIVGGSETGKSLLAKKVALELIKTDLYITVYDPVLADDWPEDAFVSDDEVAFWEEVNAVHEGGHNQAVFVDEADTILSISHKHNHWLLTRGRHYGIEPFVITQRPVLVAPTIRALCNELYCFRVSAADAKLLSDDFAHPDILAATELGQGEFLRCFWKDKRKIVDKGRIF